VAGVSINPDGAGGGLAGTNPTGITIRATDITDSGTQATQPGIELTTGGGLTFSGTVSVSTTVARALDLTGAALSGAIASTTVSGGTNGGVSLTNTTGSLTFQALSLTTTGGTGFLLANAANVDVDGAGFATSVTSTGGPAVDATTLASGTDLVFDSVIAAGTLTKGVNLDGTGNWTFSAGAGSIAATSQVGVDVNGGSGAVSYAGTIANGTGEAVDVTGRSGNTTISGNITGAGGTGINVANNTAGTTTFSGTTKTLNTGANTAVTLSSNTGHTINFTNGGLDIDTTSGGGISATGGGTVNVQGTGNTILSGTGTALSVSGVAIGAGALTFQSISATGSANGIVLANTGSAGGLAVTGTGGTCTSAVSCTGGAIQNTSGDAVNLSSTAGTSLTDMHIASAGGSWVDASSVDGLNLTRVNANLSTSHGILGSSVRNLAIQGGVYDQGGVGGLPTCNIDGVHITNLLGSSSINGGVTFRRSNTRQFFVVNNAATSAFPGTPDTLTVSNSNWNTHTGPCGGDHLSLSADTNANMRVVTNAVGGINTVTTGGIGVQAAANGTNGRMDADITGLKTSGNTAGAVVAATASASITYNIHDNNTDPAGTVNDTGFSATGSLALAATCTTSASCVGTINNNEIDATAGGGTDAMQAVLEGNGTHTIRIANMDIAGNFQRGINLSSGGGTGAVGTMNATLTSNVISGSDPAALQGVNITAGLSGSPGNGETNKLCLDMVGNTSSQANGSSGFRLTNRASNVFQLQNFAGSGANATDISNWVTAAPKSNVGTVAVQNAPTTFGPFSAAPANCPTPP
jgi:hypothetical protein